MKFIAIFLFVPLMASFQAIASTVTVDVTAEYKPSADSPNVREFVNTTPSTGFCEDLPNICASKGFFSIKTNGVEVKKTLLQDSNLPEHMYRVKVDGQYRDVKLQRVGDDRIVDVRFRLNAFATALWEPNVPGKQPIPKFWSSVIHGGCELYGLVQGATTVKASWEVPNAVSDCWLNDRADEFGNDINGYYWFSSVSFGYELLTPDAFGVPNGVYQGEVVYTVGNGGDIDFYADYYKSSEVRFTFTVTVQHSFNVTIPDYRKAVTLEPFGGWTQWLNGGRVPSKLSRDVDFNLTTSGPIRISLLCQYDSGTRCALKNSNDGSEVPLNTQITIPGLRVGEGGEEVKDYYLSNIAIFQNFYPMAYLFETNSMVHFSVFKEDIETMVKQPGSEWSGQVTLMFEAMI